MDRTATRIIRKIVKIDEDKCDGCGLCINACAEGALQIIDGKARLVSDKYCDSLGACLGECPRGAIIIEEREAEPFDEEAVKEHLAEENSLQAESPCGCPGSAVRQFEKKETLPCGCPSGSVAEFSTASNIHEKKTPESYQPARLGHWPLQLTLVPPKAPFLQGADLLLAADCTAFSYGAFHRDFLADRALLVACPKLDNYDAHQAKLTEILQQSDVKSLTVLRMEVPCCAGLTRMAMQAILSSNKTVPFKEVILGIRGEIKS